MPEEKRLGARLAVGKTMQSNHPQGKFMTTETHEHDFEHHRVDNAVHQRDYAGFISLLKWTMVIVAIISAAVIFIISN